MTTASDAILVMSGLIDYCERCAPGFAKALRPALPVDVDAVIGLTGVQVPAEYRAFLLAFGRTDPAALAPFMEAFEFGCHAIEDFYQDPPVPLADDVAYLWSVDGGGEMFLGVAGEWANEHPVLSFSWGMDRATGKFVAAERRPFVVSASLPAFLYRQAHSQLQRLNLAHRVRLRENAAPGERSAAAAAERGRRFVAVMEKLGFRPLPFLDADVPIYERGDAAVSLFLSEVAEDSMNVAASNAREASRIAEILCDNLGARRFG